MKPFIIWTLQRTGGTSLRVFLRKSLGGVEVLGEPFNLQGKFGWVTEGWNKRRNKKETQRDLELALNGKPLIKHTFELRPHKFNIQLLKASVGLGYQHILLDRRNEVNRILSLEAARITGAWGKTSAERKYQSIFNGESILPEIDVKDAVKKLERCQLSRRKMINLFASHQIDPHCVFYEDIYTDFSIGKERLIQILNFVSGKDYIEADIENMGAFEAIRNRDQRTADILPFFPNFEDARSALETASHLSTSHF